MIETMKKIQNMVGGAEYPGGYENYAIAFYKDRVIFNGVDKKINQKNIDLLFKELDTSLMFILTSNTRAYHEASFARNRYYNKDNILSQTIDDYDSQEIVNCLNFIQLLKVCLDLVHNKKDKSMHYIYFYTEEQSTTYMVFDNYSELEKEYQELKEVMGEE